MTPFRIPSRDEIAPRLSDADLVSRALAICPDLEDHDIIVVTLHRCGLSVSAIGVAALDAAIAEAKAARLTVSLTD